MAFRVTFIELRVRYESFEFMNSDAMRQRAKAEALLQRAEALISEGVAISPSGEPVIVQKTAADDADGSNDAAARPRR